MIHTAFLLALGKIKASHCTASSDSVPHTFIFILHVVLKHCHDWWFLPFFQFETIQGPFHSSSMDHLKDNGQQGFCSNSPETVHSKQTHQFSTYLKTPVSSTEGLSSPHHVISVLTVEMWWFESQVHWDVLNFFQWFFFVLRSTQMLSRPPLPFCIPPIIFLQRHLANGMHFPCWQHRIVRFSQGWEPWLSSYWDFRYTMIWYTIFFLFVVWSRRWRYIACSC